MKPKNTKSFLVLGLSLMLSNCLGAAFEGTPLAANRYESAPVAQKTARPAKIKAESPKESKGGFFATLFKGKKEDGESPKRSRRTSKKDSLNEKDLMPKKSKTNLQKQVEQTLTADNSEALNREEIERIIESDSNGLMVPEAKPVRKIVNNPASKNLVAKAVKQIEAGDSSSAEWSLEEAIRMSPNYGPAYFWMAKVKYDGQNFSQARSFLSKAETLLPDDGDWPGKLQTLKTKIALGGM